MKRVLISIFLAVVLLIGATMVFLPGASASDNSNDHPKSRNSDDSRDSRDYHRPHRLVDDAVYTMTNDPAGNEVVVFDRDNDGMLTMADSVATQGLGSGGVFDPLVSQGSLIISDNGRWLIAVNAASNRYRYTG